MLQWFESKVERWLVHGPRVTGIHHEHLLIVISVQQELEIKKYYGITLRSTRWQPIVITVNQSLGGLAQMVERPLSMREVPGSIPGFSTGLFFISSILLYLKTKNIAFSEEHLQFIILLSLLVAARGDLKP